LHRRLLFTLLLLLSATTLFAKTKPHSIYRDYYEEEENPNGWLLSAFSSFSYVNYLPQPGTLSIQFPYKLTTRDATPVTTTHTFSSQETDLIGTGKWVYPSVGIEVGKGPISIEARMGWYIHYWSDNLYGGINYRFILHRARKSPNRLDLAGVSLPGKTFVRGAASFPVKITAGLFYYQPIWTLGAIEAGDQECKALGYTMQGLDSSSLGNSGVITVYYHQNILAFQPSFSIGYRPSSNRLDVSFSVSPMINISEVGGLRFYLNNSGNVDWVPRNGIDLDAVIPLNTFGLNATFNGEELQQTPFHLKGVMYTLKIGIRII